MLETKIAGIPCLIKVLHYSVQAPDYSTWDSDLDYYGYTECDYEVYDKRGRRAEWLAAKMTDADADRIVDEITQDMQAA